MIKRLQALCFCLALVPSLLCADGWAPSGEQIKQITTLPYFTDKSPEQIAPYTAHPHPMCAQAAARALASHGNKAIPLIKKMLVDDHPAVRLGAVTTLGEMYRYEGKNPRHTAPEGLAEVIPLLKPLVSDPDSWVRGAVVDFVMIINTETEEIYDLLYEIASDPDATVRGKVDHFGRWSLTVPAGKVRIATRLLQASSGHQADALGGAMLAPHLELTRESVPVMIEYLDRYPLTQWGMLTQGNTSGPLSVIEQHAKDPIARPALLPILRLYMGKHGSAPWWNHLQESPRRIMVDMGPDIVPQLQAFIEAQKYINLQYESGEKTAPNKDWNKDSYTRRMNELRELVELIPAIHGTQPANKAIATLCQTYLVRGYPVINDRIREALVKLGPQATAGIDAFIPKADTIISSMDEAFFDAGLTSEEVADPKNRNKKITLHLKILAKRRLGAENRVKELQMVSEFIRAINQKALDQPAVSYLCKTYSRTDWPLFKQQIRQRLLSAPTRVAAMIEKGYVAEKVYLDEELAKARSIEADARAGKIDWKKHLVTAEHRIQDLEEADQHLRDMALVLKWQSLSALPADATADLCRVYTRNGWTESEPIIERLFTTADGKADIIPRHVEAEGHVLDTARSEMIRFEPYVVRAEQYKEQFMRHKALYYKLLRMLPKLEQLK